MPHVGPTLWVRHPTTRREMFMHQMPLFDATTARLWTIRSQQRWLGAAAALCLGTACGKPAAPSPAADPTAGSAVAGSGSGSGSGTGSGSGSAVAGSGSGSGSGSGTGSGSGSGSGTGSGSGSGSGSGTGSGSGSGTGSGTGSGSGSGSDQRAAAPAAPALTEAEVRAVLEQWLMAQNSGDAAAYQKLYAERMTGIKRAGSKVRQYDRKRWMADRVPRFAKKQEVTASDVQIQRSGAMAQVRFVQTYATGSFQDKGNKVLLLVREGDAAKIAREEMLDSTLLGAADLPPPLAQHLLAFAVSGGDSPWLKLGEATASDATGPARLVEGKGPWVAVRSLAPAASGALSTWQGRAVIGYNALGEVCRGQLAELGVISRVVPHFGVVQEWDGTHGGDKADDAAVAAAIVELAGGAGVRAGRVAPADGKSCKGAVWFRAADAAPAEPLAKSNKVDPELLQAAIAQLQRQPAYLSLQKDYQAEVADPKPAQWWSWEDGATAVLFTGNGKTWLAVHKRAGDFCGGFGAELGAIWQVDGGGSKPVLQLLAVGSELGEVQAALDADADGEPEFVVPRLFEGIELWRKVGPVWKAVDHHDVPYLDCPC